MAVAVAVAVAMTHMTYRAGIARYGKAQPRETSAVQKRGTIQGINDDTGWLITLSDLTLLLLSFLIVWYVKNHELNTISRAVNSAPPLAQVNDGREDIPAASPHDADWSALKDEIEKFVAGAGLGRDVSITAAPNEILISFKDAIPFASGKADLRPEGLPVLEKVAAVAVSRPALHLGISGHTDDRPISTAEFPSNWELSSARASRVARYLIEKGVHPERIEVQGFADHRPRLPNENRSGRGANRRVEIRLLRNSDDVTASKPISENR